MSKFGPTLADLYRKPYDRLEKETDKAWKAFLVFRDLKEDRTRKAVAEQMGTKIQQISQWARKYHWDERILAYDRDLDLARRTGEFEAEKHYAKRARKTALLMQTMAHAELVKLHKEVTDNTDIRILKPAQVVKMAMKGDELERLSLGLATTIVEERTEAKVDLRLLSDEDLRKLKEIKEKVEKLDTPTASER